MIKKYQFDNFIQKDRHADIMSTLRKLCFAVLNKTSFSSLFEKHYGSDYREEIVSICLLHIIEKYNDRSLKFENDEIRESYIMYVFKMRMIDIVKFLSAEKRNVNKVSDTTDHEMVLEFKPSTNISADICIEATSIIDFLKENLTLTEKKSFCSHYCETSIDENRSKAAQYKTYSRFIQKMKNMKSEIASSFSRRGFKYLLFESDIMQTFCREIETMK